MKKVLFKKNLKITAILLCLICGILAVAGWVGLGFFGMTEDGDVFSDREKTKETFYNAAGNNYAALMLDRMDPEDPETYLCQYEHLNMDFALLSLDHSSIQKKDLANQTSYLYKSPDYEDFTLAFSGSTYSHYRYTSQENILRVWRNGAWSYGESAPVKEQADTKYYWILYKVKDSFTNQTDLFAQADRLAGILCFLYRILIPVTIIFTVLLVLLLTVLARAAGRREGSDEIHIRGIDRVPLEIYIGLVFLGISAGMACGVSLLTETGYMAVPIQAFFVLTDAVLIGLLCIALFMSIAVRVKTKTLLRSTLIYKCVKAAGNVLQKAMENLPLTARTCLVLGILFLAQLTVLRLTRWHSFQAQIFLFIIYKLIETPVIIWAVLQMSLIKDGTRRIASGESTAPISTEHMYWDFKKHAEDINHLGHGITKAVEEQMKSERMKTELITNVSHDIKTPLTSIINYVDLLGKEELNNEKAEGYLEVLKRQSDKLKKLIGDLIEASRASTGNLDLTMEACDLSVIFAQAFGEFEEKFTQRSLTFLTDGIREGLMIQADGRYLWRIFDNLFSNISKYAMTGTRVYINVKEGTDLPPEILQKEQAGHSMRIEQFVRIEMKNISAAPLNISSEELMERFVRGDSSRNTEGSGLGLSIAASLAGLMGGSLHTEIDGDLFKVILYFKK